MKRISKEKFFRNYVSNFVIIIMLGLISVVTLNFGSINVISHNKLEPIYYGNRDTSYVSLMINVYWGTEYIETILETLDKYDIKTTFFVGGTWVEKEPEMLKLIHEKGHEIGNHGYFHKDHDKLSYDDNYDEINITHKLVKSTIDIDMNLFAPPSGAFNNTTLTVANDLGYKTIMWSKDTIDWRDKDSELVFRRATKNVTPGDLILMHPTEHTAKALPRILDYYNSNNIIATTVSNTIK